MRTALSLDTRSAAVRPTRRADQSRSFRRRPVQALRLRPVVYIICSRWLLKLWCYARPIPNRFPVLAGALRSPRPSNMGVVKLAVCRKTPCSPPRFTALPLQTSRTQCTSSSMRDTVRHLIPHARLLDSLYAAHTGWLFSAYRPKAALREKSRLSCVPRAFEPITARWKGAVTRPDRSRYRCTPKARSAVVGRAIRLSRVVSTTTIDPLVHY